MNKLKFDYPDETPSRPVKPVRKTSSKTVTQETEEEPIPYAYHKVYVESVLDTKPCVSLEAAGFPGSVCKVLSRLGFQTPTLAQGASWPLVGKDKSLTIIVSPPNSGKTLAYLLPLVTKREVSHPRSDVPHPRLIVVVRSSWGAQAVHTRAVELMSAQSAHRRFRSCAAYQAQEKAIVQVLGGVEVLVCTPDCLLQLIDKTVVQLDSLAYLVLDDFEKLQKNFSTEISKILALCSSSTCSGPVGVVVTTSQWSETVEAVPSLISDHTHLCSSPTHLVIACPIEATVRAKVKMSVIPCLEVKPESVLPKQLSLMGPGSCTVVCVATTETADRVLRNLHRQCLSVAVVKEEEKRNVKELFKKQPVVVVTDGAVPLLIQTGPLVSTVIHYELPTNRTAFTNRLTLLYPAIHRGVACGHSIMLTERWNRQAGLLREMMERMGQSCAEPLLRMAEKLLQEKEEKRKDFDLCYDLKAWGVCSDPICSYRHIHTISPSSFPSPQPLDLPKDGSIKVMVKYVSTATRWWVSLLGHAPLYRGAEPVKSDPDGLLKMSFSLAEYFTSDRQRNTLHSVPAVGNYCALRDRDGSFYRVRILKFSQPLEFMFHHREKALVRLIDVGEAKIVDVSQLLELPQHLLAPPANVFEIFVCRIKPSDCDPDWPPQAAEMMEREYRNQTLHGRVSLVSGETVWLHPIEKKVHHKVSNIVAALTSPQQQMKDTKMGENNPQHLVNLANCLGLPLVRAENIVTIDDPCVSFASLKNEKGSYVDVCVSAVDSPNRFYLQPMATESRVIELENSLNRYRGVCSMVVQPVAVGSVCAAQFSENRSWYRGCVLGVEGHESKIRFLDYGNVEWVMNHLVQPIHPSLLELPFQAICATFGMDDTDWGTEAGDLLYEWTREIVLTAKVKSAAPSSSKLLHGPECATVQLFEKSSSCSDGLGTNVALRLPGARPQTTEPQPVRNLFLLSSSSSIRSCRAM
jgi:superfamily II DNA/RNA helicase